MRPESTAGGATVPGATADVEACRLPSELDLAPLEKAAERAGLGALRAVVVAPDPRRDRWFDWDAAELRVNERVLERLVPQDACVLLLNAILLHRRRRRAVAGIVALDVGFLASLGAVFSWYPSALIAFGVASALLVAAFSVLILAWSAQAADDDTVAWLGDADTLCRALNSMNQDKLQLAGRRLAARPDLHRRAERLVTKHQLRLAPEDRTAPPIQRRGPDVLA